MNAPINRYQADLRDMFFLLFEQFHYSEVVGKPPFEDWGNEEAQAVLEETYRFVREVTGPLNSIGDRDGCKLEAGQVYTPKGFKEAWSKLYETGFKTLAVEPEHGGQGAPRMLQVLVEEMLSGANPAFNTYAGLAFGAAELIAECGTGEQVLRYAEGMFQGKWGGTMCLTEPHAGSDVGAAKTSAKKNPDGTYRIRGTKIFISAGDHDLTENIIHLVLARVENAPPGTKGLSLFIVPKRRLNPDGSSGESNDVQVASIEHKMGINGSATCVLNFGDNDQCLGELVGTSENVGMSQMFRMMNGARIAVGLQGLAVLSAAYLSALEYAKERRQGANYRFWKDPSKPRVPIIEHPDVRRMLIEMKANAEGIRALVMKLASHLDRGRQLSGSQDDQASYHHGQVELLTPLLKAYASEAAFRLSAEAIQVYGGAGYLKDHPVEQYCRDAKIFSIYEGTTHIQAMDLVGRKLAQAGGAHFQAFMQDIGSFAELHRRDPRYGQAVEALARAQEALLNSTMGLISWSQSDKLHLIPLNANRFLTSMAQLAIGWLLLDAAMIAERKLENLPEVHHERAFYEGKRYSALWFARNVLPAVEQGAHLIAAEDSSPMEMPEAAFAAA
jgi:alkylation response protein AidB-like acyl-CoA dehydrogenase